MAKNKTESDFSILWLKKNRHRAPEIRELLAVIRPFEEWGASVWGFNRIRDLLLETDNETFIHDLSIARRYWYWAQNFKSKPPRKTVAAKKREVDR